MGFVEEVFTDLRCALRGLGYREADVKVWLKPIAYQAFRFDEDELRWTNIFKDAQGEICIYQQEILKPQDIGGPWLRQIKSLECFTRTDLCPESVSSFEFMALSELLDMKGL